MSWNSFKIQLSHLKFDGDKESVSYFDKTDVFEIYFMTKSGKPLVVANGVR
jgi:hypothetical protein